MTTAMQPGTYNSAATPLPVEEIAARAAGVRFWHVVAVAVAAVFFAAGWLPGKAWHAVVFCALMTRYGFRAGAGYAAEPPAQQQQAAGR